MKEEVVYIKRCVRCEEESRYILRAKDVNPGISDEDVQKICRRYSEKPDDICWCEKCKLITRQEIIAFDY